MCKLCINDTDIVFDLAEKLQDPEWVKNILFDEKNRNAQMPDFIPWDDLSLAHGYPSLIVYYYEMHKAYPNQRWDFIMHDYVKVLVRCIEKTGVQNYSLFAGLAGICYALSLASNDEKTYTRVVSKLNSTLIKCIGFFYLDPLLDDIKQGRFSSVFKYDLIQGIVGIGIYLLTQVDQSEVQSALLMLIQTLIQRMMPVKFEGIELPGWYIPFEHQFIDEDKHNYPKGNFNMGLAHGVPGVLAFLSIAYLKGMELPGQKDTIIQIAEWIKTQAIIKNDIHIWPERVKWDPQNKLANEKIFMQRMGWCYGKPGILRSLYLAGQALKNQELMKYSLIHFKEIFQCNPEDWYLPGPAFCHGILGLYTITNHMAKDTKDLLLRQKTADLKSKLMDAYHMDHPFGFVDLEPETLNREERLFQFAKLNKVGLLDGSVGIALALLESSKNINSKWDLPFLIS